MTKDENTQIDAAIRGSFRVGAPLRSDYPHGMENSSPTEPGGPNSRRLRSFVAASIFALAVARPGDCLAADVVWDANLGTAGAQNGNGTWQVGGFSSNWWDGGGNVDFSNGDTVTLGTSSNFVSPTVTVAGTVQTPSLTFGLVNPSGNQFYTLTNGTIDFGTGGDIIVDARANQQAAPVVYSTLVGSNLTTSGAGWMKWEGSNALTGTLTVGNGGRLFIDNILAIEGGGNDLDKIVLEAGKRIEFGISGAAAAAGTYTTPIEMGGSGATLSTQIDGVTIAGDITLGGTDNSVFNVDFTHSLTFSGDIGGSGTLQFAFAGGGNGEIVLTGQSTFTGDAVLTGDGGDRVVLTGGDDRLPTTTRFVINSANTLVLGDASNTVDQTFAGLGGNNAGGTIIGGHATNAILTIDKASVTDTFIGRIGVAGAGGNTNHIAIVKDGAGIQIFSGTNAYAGGTTVNGGLLIATRTNSLPGFDSPASVVANNGGTLAVQAGGEWTSSDIATLLGNATLNSGSAFGIQVGTGNTYTNVNALSGNIGFWKGGAGTLAINTNHGYTGDTTLNAGRAILVGGTDNRIDPASDMVLENSAVLQLGDGSGISTRAPSTARSQTTRRSTSTRTAAIARSSIPPSRAAAP